MIVTLELKNFCQHEKLLIDFRAGLNGITGANGKGKSNILDAIRFADTGESANSGNLNTNVRWGADSATVKATYVVGDTHFSIKRTINASGKGGSSQLVIKGGETYNKIGEIADQLDKIYASNKEARLNNVYIKQSELDAIIDAKPATRYEEFQKTFGMENLRKAHDWLKVELTNCLVTPDLEAKLSTAAADFEASRTASTDLAVKRYELEKEIAAVAGCEAVLAQAIRALQVQSALTVATKAVEAAQHAAHQSTGFAQLAMQTETTAHDYAMVAGRAGVAAKAMLDEILTQEAAWVQTSRIRQAIVADEAALGALPVPLAPPVMEALHQTVSRLREEVAVARSQVANPPKLPQQVEAETELAATRVTLAQLAATPAPDVSEWQVQLRAAEQHLALAKAGKCPTCGSASVHDPAALQAEIARLKAAISGVQDGHRDTLAIRTTACRTTITQLEAVITNCVDVGKSFMGKHLAALTLQLENAQRQAIEGQALWDKHTQLSQRIDAGRRSIAGGPTAAPDAALKAEAQRLVLEHQQAEQALQKASYEARSAQQQLQSATKALEVARAHVVAIGTSVDMPSDEALAKAKVDAQQLAQHRAVRETLLAEIGINQAMLAQRQGEATRLREKFATEQKLLGWVEDVKLARDTLHHTALPALAMREFARILNVRMEHYLTLWNTPFKFWLNDDMAFEVEDENGQRFDARRLSGGQRVMASISFRLAMSDTFSAGTGMIVLDEPGAYLDVDNIQLLQSIFLKLKETAAATHRQILVVHHGQELAGFLDHIVSI